MLRGHDTLALGRIALWGFGLNTAWEFGSARSSTTCGTGASGRRPSGGAIFGDVVIVLGVALGATLLAGARHLRPPDAAGWAVLLGAGFVAAVGLEWTAQALGLWGYSDLMPTVAVLGHTVGLSPVVQVTILPALACWLAGRQLRRGHGVHRPILGPSSRSHPARRRMNAPLVPEALVEDAARRLKVLGDPVRLSLLNALRVHEELNVQELMDLTEQRQANVSKHLGILAREGIVRRRKEGTNAFYSIADPSIAGVYLLVCNRLRERSAASEEAS